MCVYGEQEVANICEINPVLKLDYMRLGVPLEIGVLFDLMFLPLRGGINSLHNLERKNATSDDVEPGIL